MQDRTSRTREKLWQVLTGGDPAAEAELTSSLAWSRHYLLAVCQGQALRALKGMSVNRMTTLRANAAYEKEGGRRSGSTMGV
jgi:hypothetical protein